MNVCSAFLVSLSPELYEGPNEREHTTACAFYTRGDAFLFRDLLLDRFDCARRFERLDENMHCTHRNSLEFV